MAVSQKGFQLEALAVHMDPLDKRLPGIPEGWFAESCLLALSSLFTASCK